MSINKVSSNILNTIMIQICWEDVQTIFSSWESFSSVYIILIDNMHDCQQSHFLPTNCSFLLLELHTHSICCPHSTYKDATGTKKKQIENDKNIFKNIWIRNFYPLHFLIMNITQQRKLMLSWDLPTSNKKIVRLKRKKN